jgi:hypothetical protein
MSHWDMPRVDRLTGDEAKLCRSERRRAGYPGEERATRVADERDGGAESTRLTGAGGRARLDRPQDRLARISVVPAQMPGVDASRERTPEHRVGVTNAADRATDRLGHAHPAAFVVVGHAARSAGETELSPQMVDEEPAFLSSPSAAFNVTEDVGGVKLAVEFTDPPLVVAASLIVDPWRAEDCGGDGQSVDGRGELSGGNVGIGVGQQVSEVAQADQVVNGRGATVDVDVPFRPRPFKSSPSWRDRNR